MKLWGLLSIVLLVVLPILSACGPSDAEKAQRKAYEDGLKIYQERMNAYNEQVEAYQKAYQEGLKEYLEAYGEYQQEAQKQQIQQIEEAQAK